jgi:hypothetical protein
LPPTTVATWGAIDDHRLFDKGGFGNRGSVYPMDRRRMRGVKGNQHDGDCGE